MTLVPVKTPWVVKKTFPNYIWDVATNEKVIYLTFDDGPTPDITEWTLNILKTYKAKATFFCIGNNIEKHPDIFQQILKQGHAIGNHTYNHAKGWKTNTANYCKEVDRTQVLINSCTPPQTQQQGHLFRPPYGQIKPKQAKELIASGYKIIMWDVISFDWDKDIPEETCFDNVKNNAVNGSIVVFHDSIKASKNMLFALPKVLEYYSNLGYTFKSLKYN
ncbi:polysaccharide deacetylase family protein [Yeosuana marina]|uniref:polysaccharide deacetylase family protein n=1 Tax=Yeosuana marina TaxID=1565536 RepID=UPI0030ECF3BC|tara:strand:- start:190 stop:846 length:657 start_codon:yes stop_codon:yes gene_type:complete